MTGAKELAYVVYEVSDLDAWERFAVGLLGMQVGHKDADSISFRTDDKAYRWFCTRGPADDLSASGYEVDGDESLDAIVAALTAAGVEVTEGDADLAAARKADRIVVTADPVGNRVELITGFSEGATPFRSETLLGQFVTGVGGAGHQVLVDKGVSREDYLAFYVDLLGFKISDHIVQELAPGMVADVVFLHCNPRHHTVAFGNMPHPKKTHHFMIEVSDIRDVGLAYDRCLDAKQPLEMTLGMHPNDRMFSFYVRTPSGFSVEYGWGGLLIDDDTWEITTHGRLSSWGHRPPEQVHALLGQAPFTNTPPGVAR